MGVSAKVYTHTQISNCNCIYICRTLSSRGLPCLWADLFSGQVYHSLKTAEYYAVTSLYISVGAENLQVSMVTLLAIWFEGKEIALALGVNTKSRPCHIIALFIKPIYAVVTSPPTHPHTHTHAHPLLCEHYDNTHTHINTRSI